MHKKIVFIVFLGLLSMATEAQTLQQSYLDYIARFRATAVLHQTAHGIPASITLAQGLLESGAGQSELARNANNHFGIKCTSDWQGATYHYDDDRRDECFRKYNHADSSYADHARFLMRPRYKELFALPVTDYKGWAYGLSRCGYATDPNYPEKLIKLIEDYGLAQTTADQPAAQPALPAAKPDTIFAADTIELAEEQSFREASNKMGTVNLYHEHRSGYQNGNRYIVVNDGESFLTLSYLLTMSEKQLRKINDATDGRELQPGDRVYLYPKPRRADKKHARYYVRTGDTAWSISQKFCFQMKTIYELNGIPYGTPLTTRQELRLR
ncbi:MAG: glucosaminidase domain-containing protein [Paludibacteraceae bacterium]|nr:glucosaminidase domain-containing protein [Paludibacteraceae bacterium]